MKKKMMKKPMKKMMCGGKVKKMNTGGKVPPKPASKPMTPKEKKAFFDGAVERGNRMSRVEKEEYDSIVKGKRKK